MILPGDYITFKLEHWIGEKLTYKTVERPVDRISTNPLTKAKGYVVSIDSIEDYKIPECEIISVCPAPGTQLQMFN